MIRFLLCDAEETISDLDPATSILSYLRDVRRRSGTKNGCSTGDCGACTVVLGDLNGEALRYRAVNACITPLFTLHGKQLITVEHLKHVGDLHTVQQAMVDCHGSQCGFCTPGIVMSLFAHLQTHSQPQKDTLIDSLCGNLCRCTGYRPILDAGIEMYASPLDDQFRRNEADTVVRLRAIAGSTQSVEAELNGKRCFAPQSIRQLAPLLQTYPDALLLAGGTDLMPGLVGRSEKPDVVVYTGNIAELQECSASGETLEIGAAVPYSDCVDLLVEEYPGLREIFRRFGSQQVRNLGTLAGNIGSASPCGDMLPFLIVVGAALVLRSGNQTRIEGVGSFLVGYRKTSLRPGEFIERVIIPKAKPGYLLQAYKVSKRLDDDISSSCAAFHVRIEDGVIRDAGIAYGGMADIAKRASHCEGALVGQAWNQATIDEAMRALEDDFTPISDFRASANYRMQASKNLLQRLFLECNDSAPGLSVRHYEH